MAEKVMRIKELRKESGLRQIELGAAMGVNQSTVSEWEVERCLPLARQLPLLAHVLGCFINELFEPIEDVS